MNNNESKIAEVTVEPSPQWMKDAGKEIQEKYNLDFVDKVYITGIIARHYRINNSKNNIMPTSILDSLSTEAKIAAKTLWSELKNYEPKNDQELMFLHYYKEVLTEELLESNRSLRKKGSGNYGNSTRNK